VRQAALAPRRRLLAAIAALPLVRAAPALADAIPLAIGADPTGDAAPLLTAMQTDDLINKAAEELRTSLALSFVDATGVTRMVQALLAGQIQVGTLGSAPLIRMLAGANPAIPIALAGGGMNFPLLVPPESLVHDLAGLPGATVFTLPGSDAQLALVLMLQAQFGDDNLQKLRITLRPAKSAAELGEAPVGVDAVMGVQPLGYAAERVGKLVTLLFNDGSTGAAWKGPEGNGAGHRVRSFARAPLAPEAYYPHRLWWVARQDFLHNNPELVLAFLAANARAAAAMTAAPPARVIELAGAKWPGDPSDKERFVERILWRRRGWAWITEADVHTLIVLSGVRSQFEKALKADDLVRLLKLAAPLTRKAWILSGARPSLSAFTSSDSDDPRGAPMWDVDKWRL
jgi:ABC-type nitrate/sulfonate/bicarbonate transport system substrate-binding protein